MVMICHYSIAIARVHPVHLMYVDSASGRQLTKPTDLSHASACLSAAIVYTHQYDCVNELCI